MIKYHDDEYSINSDFQEICLQLADFLELDEIDAAKLLLDSEADQIAIGRSLLECGVIRFHQRRKFLLDCIRLILQISADDELGDEIQEVFGTYVDNNIYGHSLGTQDLHARQNQLVPKCLTGIRETRLLLQKLSERLAGQSIMSNCASPAVQETMEYTRMSLIQQHELLCTILCMAVEKQHGTYDDFSEFLEILRKTDKYDNLLAHLFPALGSFISLFGSPDSTFATIHEAKKINSALCKPSNAETWTLPYLAAAATAWWISEYSGWYADNAVPEIPLSEMVQEETLINEKFMESLKDGAFDMLLSIAADVQPAEWQDPARSGMRHWLQRKAPFMISDTTTFSDYFHASLMSQLEMFVDSFITNLPDILRKLRVEEDEQRQLNHDHEQDLNLERFLLIIAYTYDGRPEAGATFWDDPESNLAGFMQWASRRASTPLVSTFCEALQSISNNEECATAAHLFLSEKSHKSSGKMRQSLSLTWSQIFKELVYFSARIREKPNLPQSHSYKGTRASHEPAESEPESAMMLESYLRLIAKLAYNSATARHFLLETDPDFNLVTTLFELAASAIPPRLRACIFNAQRALMTSRLKDHSDIMWNYLDLFVTGGFQVGLSVQRPGPSLSHSPGTMMENVFTELSSGFEESNAFIQFLNVLLSPLEPVDPLNDGLPFPEDIGSVNRHSGIEPYVDFVLGQVFSLKSKELVDMTQLRMLRLSCLEFIFGCLCTFNENLIVLGSETSINIDQAISTSDLSAYIRLHPFARVMEWMFNDNVIHALLSTLHQDPIEVGNATPNSPLILGILKSVEIVSKVLDLQTTYLDLVRKHIKIHSPKIQRYEVSNMSYGSFEDGLQNHISMVVDLGIYCSIGHPDLTLACLKLLEKVSTSTRIITGWNTGTGQLSHRNKAIVALESNDEGDAIAGALVSELVAPLDLVREADSPNYQIKVYILEFLYACIMATPYQPTIAHLLLGFKCESSGLSVSADGAFGQKTSLFHNLLRVMLETPFGDDSQVRYWLVNLKFKIIRVLQALWTSPLSSTIVMAELRENEILFHMLLREISVQAQLPWEGLFPTGPNFITETSGMTFIYFLSTRAMMLEYMSMELCDVSQGQLPGLKRKIFDALNGSIRDDDDMPMDIPTIFDLFDFLHDGPWYINEPQFKYCGNLNTAILMKHDSEGNRVFDIDRAREMLLLKQGELRSSGRDVAGEDFTRTQEEPLFLEYLLYRNRLQQLHSARLRVLKSWTNVVLVMTETSDFKGAAKFSFLLQALHAILPSLEQYGSEAPEEAYQLASVAKILLHQIQLVMNDQTATNRIEKRNATSLVHTGSNEIEQRAVSTLIWDKLHQLFRICLELIGKWVGKGELRTVYYTICYRYLTAVMDQSSGANCNSSESMAFMLEGAKKALVCVHDYGERLINAICDDAYSSDPAVQTAALTLLRTLVAAGANLDNYVTVEILNRINFTGVIVDSLRNVMHEWVSIITPSESKQSPSSTNSFIPDQSLIAHMRAKLALLLMLAQTKPGSKHLVHANFLRTVEQSGLFAADPELQLDSSDMHTLALHYELLACVARIVATAIISRGEHNIAAGRNFLKTHRTLVLHVLKRSAGIGMPNKSGVLTPLIISGSAEGRKTVSNYDMVAEELLKQLRENIADLAEAFMLLITATSFLDVSFPFSSLIRIVNPRQIIYFMRR